MSGGARNWDAHDGNYNYGDWTDYSGYGGRGYGNWGYGWGRGSGDRHNEEEENWDDASNDKEKEGYYPTREEIKEDARMLGKLKPDWMNNGYGWGGYGGYNAAYGGKGGKGGKEDKKAMAEKKDEGGDDKAAL